MKEFLDELAKQLNKGVFEDMGAKIEFIEDDDVEEKMKEYRRGVSAEIYDSLPKEFTDEEMLESLRNNVRKVIERESKLLAAALDEEIKKG